jgi:hypothetical protein
MTCDMACLVPIGVVLVPMARLLLVDRSTARCHLDRWCQGAAHHVPGSTACGTTDAWKLDQGHQMGLSDFVSVACVSYSSKPALVSPVTRTALWC